MNLPRGPRTICKTISYKVAILICSRTLSQHQSTSKDYCQHGMNLFRYMCLLRHGYINSGCIIFDLAHLSELFRLEISNQYLHFLPFTNIAIGLWTW